MQARLGAVVALAAVALAAGCGGGGDGGGDRLTAEEFVQQADAICADANQQIDELGEPQSMEELATMAAEAVSISEQSVAALQELVPPEEFQERFDRALELLDQQLELARQLQTAAENGDEAQVQSIADEGEPLDAEADDIAEELGLTECGQN